MTDAIAQEQAKPDASGAQKDVCEWTDRRDGSPILKGWDFTDTAARFLTWRGERWANLIHFNNDWLDYRDGAYREVDPNTIDRDIRWFLSIAKKRTAEGKEPVPYAPTTKLVKEVERMVRMIAHLDRADAQPPCWIRGSSGPPPSEIIAFSNGLLHVPTEKLIDPTPDFFTTNRLDFPYDPRAREPELWLSMLDQYWPDDDEQDIIDTLQEFFGYVLVPDTRHHVIPVLHGAPRSGKGTILRVLRQLVGAANVTSPSFKSLGGEFGLQPWLYKLLAIISDLKFGKSTDVQTVLENLQRISGGDPVSVPRKNKTAWEGFLPTRIIVAVNPPFSIGTDHTGGLFSRLLCLPMQHSFIKNVDTTIEERLRPELPGILLWAIDGWQRLQERGKFVEPKRGRILKLELMKNASPVLAFVMDDCALEPLAATTTDDLYSAYLRWCRDEGRTALGKESFGRALLSTHHGKISKSRPRKGDDRVWTYEGIRVERSRPREQGDAQHAF